VFFQRACATGNGYSARAQRKSATGSRPDRAIPVKWLLRFPLVDESDYMYTIAARPRFRGVKPMSLTATVAAPAPRLLDQLRAVANQRFGRPAPGERYANWAYRYILFHGKRHPRELAAPEVVLLLEHVGKSANDPV